MSLDLEKFNATNSGFFVIVFRKSAWCSLEVTAMLVCRNKCCDVGSLAFSPSSALSAHKGDLETVWIFDNGCNWWLSSSKLRTDPEIENTVG